MSLDLLRPMAAALAKAGMATWNVECRRLGNPGGGWPGTFHDEQITRYESMATNKGDRVMITRMENAGHFGMLAPRAPDWNKVQGRILSLVR